MKPGILIKRYPYEEPYNIQLEFRVANGDFCGTTDIYCDSRDLVRIGSALKSFPTKVDDEFKYEYGSPDPEARCYRHLILRAYMIDAVGHSAIQFTIGNNQTEPNEGTCNFSIRADVASINRLGELFENFAKLEEFEFQWSPRLVD